MDLIHTFLNIVAPPFTFFSLMFFLPPFQFFKFFLSVLGTIFSEDIAGKVVVITGASSGIGEASKAAVSQFYETVRVEFGPDIGVTLVTPGFIESELTHGKFLNKAGRLVVDQDMRDVQVNIIPVQRVESCARAIVSSALRGERYVTEPAWFKVTYFLKLFAPEVLEWMYRILYMTRPGDLSTQPLGKKIMDYSGVKGVLYPESLHAAEPKRD